MGEDQSKLQERFHFPVYIAGSDEKLLTSHDWPTLLGLNDEYLTRHLSQEERQLVLDYVLKHDDEVLVILDGLDEVAGDEFLQPHCVLSQLLKSKRKDLRRSSVLVTSRLCQRATELLQECNTLYSLAGFSD